MDTLTQKLRRVRLNRERVDLATFPFTVPAIAGIDELAFHPRVTFLVGENGSGKSTLLEAVAELAGFSAQGGTRSFQLGDQKGASGLAEHMTLIRGAKREKGGFFLRAESFFNIVNTIDALGVSGYGDRSLHHRSHGESFLALVENRFEGDSLYLLDEPEAALSPQRQLTFLTLIHDLVQRDCQLIIATHSPILLAYPDAAILRFDDSGISVARYDELEHVQVTRDFLAAPELFLKYLLDG